MTVEKMAQVLNAKTIVADDSKRDINEFYAGDFLSRVMGKAPSDCGWFTIMNNINVAGVAVMAEVKVIILCEGLQPIEALTEKCRQEKIALIVTELGVFECCRLIN